MATAAQPQPTRLKPIKVVVPAAAGANGHHSAPGRAKMSERFGSVLVENRSGGNETIGVDAVAKSAPEALYRAAHTPAAIVVLPHLQKLPYNVDRDFAPYRSRW